MNLPNRNILEVGGDVKALSTFETEKKYSLGILSESGNQQYITLSSYDKDWLSKSELEMVASEGGVCNYN